MGRAKSMIRRRNRTGAGNVGPCKELRDSNTSAAPAAAQSPPRSFRAGCKEPDFRQLAGADSEASCNSRVLAGDAQFMLDVIDGQ